MSTASVTVGSQTSETGHARQPRLAGVWRWLPPAICASVIGAFVFENRVFQAAADDAFIFYRYAQNLVHGHGLVYNIGERVEGFTSLLWTLLIALGMAVTRTDDAVPVAHYLGVGCGVLLLWLTYVYATHGLVGKERIVAAFAPCLLWLSMPFAVWSTAGLEAPLFAAAAAGALAAEGRGRTWLGFAVAGVATLIRPEGVLLAGVLFAFAFVRRSISRRMLVVWLAGYVMLVLALTLFRLAYFGAPLPNTFYAKVGGTYPWWGAFYVFAFVVQTLPPALVPGGYAARDRHPRPGLAWAACIALFALVVGGDFFMHSRFFLPALPVVWACAVRGVIAASGGTSILARTASLGVFVCLAWLSFGTFAGLGAMVAALFAGLVGQKALVRSIVFAGMGALLVALAVVFTRRQAAEWANAQHAPDAIAQQRLAGLGMARWLVLPPRWEELARVRQEWAFANALGKQHAEIVDARVPPNTLVAAGGIGVFGYYSKVRILDVFGLVDPTIARTKSASDARFFPGHQRSNAEYVLSRKPAYIFIPRQHDSEKGLRAPAAVDLWEHPQFKRYYRWDRRVLGYRRRTRRRG